MKVYFGLGSNLGDRRENLSRAVALLQRHGVQQMKVSPVVESPALLPKTARASWNRPFLNVVVEGRVQESAEEWLRRAQLVQDAIGKRDPSRWAPRLIDVDILLWGDRRADDPRLTLPHPDMHKRAFVLVPLAHLAPDLRIPGLEEQTVLERARALPQRIPLWMGILNVTPDSFSDAGVHAHWSAVERSVDSMVDAGVHIIDVGGESTRPGAFPVEEGEEWHRIHPVLVKLGEKLGSSPVRPLISVDSRHHRVAERALHWGADMINDVSGLTSPAMMAIARESEAHWVAMHSLSIPASREITIAPDRDAVEEVSGWLRGRLDAWDACNLDLRRIIFDPGIGFGKTSLQSLELLRNVDRFAAFGLRLLIGHSRKSFMERIVHAPPAGRDLETIGASLKLCEQGADILRVHDVPSHARAYMGWAHVGK